MSVVTVTVNGEKREFAQGTTYEAIAADYQKEYDGMIALVSSNGKIRELFKKVTKDCTVEFFTLRDAVGHKTYVRTATMLFLKGICDVFGAEAAKESCVEFTIGNGLYVNVLGKVPVTAESAEKIKVRMRELVEKKTPFMKRSYSLEEAMELFRNKGMKDKEKLFHYRLSSFVNIYEIDGYYDYYYGYMLPNAGYVKWFDVMPYEEGFMLVLPSRKNPTVVEVFEERRKLFDTMESSQDWGRKAGIETVGDLNDQICSGSMSDLILIQEAEQERKIGEIAKDIVNRGNIKFVMIAGPSSSGKTSFSHRLSIQLRTMGKMPHPIALDDYFVNREQTPRDENGDYNFECLEAIDVKQFNDDMVKLLAGERVELPTFNFKTGQREYRGNYKQLGADDILVIEGIHGLNAKMSYALPEESKYKIYISALTALNVDNHNRIPTTDGRLLRRMVRDARTRGSSAQRTIQMWPSVRRGEEENIFPFQEEADAMFNSAQIFELAVLKTFAEPLLFQIPKDVPEYYEAKRLLKFLDYFLSVPSESLPNNSICREFVGGSCFNV
ncbi:MAG: nucleoside kinase [Acetatifactor sp.]|nr:nucleoside kinase [Acetatifactor sp.]